MVTRSEFKAPTSATRTKLFAKSRNRCAFPECTQPMTHEKSIVGVVCHIKGDKPGSARHDSTQAPHARQGIDNLILLCSNHHKIIDDDVETYTVECLLKMKLAHESEATPLPGPAATGTDQVSVDQSVTSQNQLGGITAHIVNLNMSRSAESYQVAENAFQMLTEYAIGTTTDTSLPAILPLDSPSFVPPHGEQLARTPSLDKNGLASDFVYWHSGPSAWLRIIPHSPKSYGHAPLMQVVERSRYPLRPFGPSSYTQHFSNPRGVTVIGYDDQQPETIATRIAHVLHSGEIWGLNKVLINGRANDSPDTWRIPWPALKRHLEDTLHNFLHFAEHELHLESPITVVAGLALVRDAIFTREPSKWFTDPPKETRCLNDTIFRFWNVANFREQTSVPDSFYEAIFDACALDYRLELRAHSWPK